MTLLALACACAGFAALALAMDRHRRQVRLCSAGVCTRLSLRFIGALFLGLSFAACVLLSGWSVGPVLWIGLLNASALVLVLLLAHAPQARCRPCAGCD